MALTKAELDGRAFTVSEVAKLLGLSAATVRLLVREGHLQAVRPPGRRGYTVRGEAVWSYFIGEPLPKAKAGR